MSQLMTELTQLLNRHSRENECDTPDFILAEFMIGCLTNFEKAACQRDAWYGSIRTAADPQVPPGEVEVLMMVGQSSGGVMSDRLVPREPEGGWPR